VQNGSQALGVDRFGDVVVGADAHGLDCAIDGSLGGNHDHCHGAALGGDFFQQFEATHAGHFHVGDDD